jgi:hypothetical protein
MKDQFYRMFRLFQKKFDPNEAAQGEELIYTYKAGYSKEERLMMNKTFEILTGGSFLSLITHGLLYDEIFNEIMNRIEEIEEEGKEKAPEELIKLYEKSNWEGKRVIDFVLFSLCGQTFNSFCEFYQEKRLEMITSDK